MNAPLSVVGGGPAVSELRVSDLGVRYRDLQAAVGVSLTVGAGRWLALIGPNGAGKSTVLKAIAGVVGHTGRIELIGPGGEVAPGPRSQRVAYVPQTPTLPPGVTTAEYVLMGRTAHLRWYQFESASDRRMVARALDDLGLADHAGRPVVELSGGEAQRVAVARAIVQQASILVLDEPTSALDLAHQVAVLELVEELRRSRQLLVVCAMHDLTLAGRFADELVLLDAGRPVMQGRPSEILTADNLTNHYGVDVAVLTGPDGGPVVVPAATNGADKNADESTEERVIHDRFRPATG